MPFEENPGRWIGDKVKSKSTNEGLTCGKRKDNSLDPCLTNQFGRGDSKPRKKERFYKECVYLLSRIPGDWTVGSRRNKRRSWSTLQGLRVGTSFMEFRQLQEVGVFSYLFYSLVKSHFNG